MALKEGNVQIKIIYFRKEAAVEQQLRNVNAVQSFISTVSVTVTTQHFPSGFSCKIRIPYLPRDTKHLTRLKLSVKAKLPSCATIQAHFMPRKAVSCDLDGSGGSKRSFGIYQ